MKKDSRLRKKVLLVGCFLLVLYVSVFPTTSFSLASSNHLSSKQIPSSRQKIQSEEKELFEDIPLREITETIDLQVPGTARKPVILEPQRNFYYYTDIQLELVFESTERNFSNMFAGDQKLRYGINISYLDQITTITCTNDLIGSDGIELLSFRTRSSHNYLSSHIPIGPLNDRGNVQFTNIQIAIFDNLTALPSISRFEAIITGQQQIGINTISFDVAINNSTSAIVLTTIPAFIGTSTLLFLLSSSLIILIKRGKN